MLRRYDEAMVNLLKVKTASGSSIPIRMAVQRREFGTQEEMSGPTPDRKPASRAGQTIPVPAMVVTRLDYTPSSERAAFTLNRKVKWSDDLNMVAQAQHPVAVDIPYQLDIWTKYRDDANLIQEAVFSRFPRLFAALTVDLGQPWGTKKVWVKLGHFVDNTDADSDDGDREVRLTGDFTLEGWHVLPARYIRTVRKVVADVDIVKQTGETEARAFSVTLEES